MKDDALRAELDHLHATNTALVITVAALLQTHPQHAEAQLRLTALLEWQLGAGSFGAVLSPAQQAQVRFVVEAISSLHPQTASAPEASALLDRLRRN